MADFFNDEAEVDSAEDTSSLSGSEGGSDGEGRQKKKKQKKKKRRTVLASDDEDEEDGEGKELNENC